MVWTGFDTHHVRCATQTIPAIFGRNLSVKGLDAPLFLSPIYPQLPWEVPRLTQVRQNDILSTKKERVFDRFKHNQTNPMLQAERRAAILRSIEGRHSVTVTQLCEELQVSDMTIRRDLREMEIQGLLRRVHGGAMQIVRQSYEPPYTLRETQLHEIKQQIGRKAADLIADSDIVALDSGTTTLEIARALEGRRELTIITGGLPIINQIASQHSLVSDIHLIVSGGIVRPREMSMIGHHPERLYRELHVDKAFVAVGGLSTEHGLTTYNLDEALVTRAMIATADQVVVVADGSKFNRVTFASIAPLSEVDVIVTDHSADKRTVHNLQEMGIELIFAD